MSRIHTDVNNVFVNALADSNEVDAESGHHYQIGWDGGSVMVDFQKGAVEENGVNGVTNEALLAILVHRTKQLNGKFPCRENAIAITKMEEALMWFDKRTADRQARGVEGKEKS